MLRGNGGQDIFFEEDDRTHLEALVSEGVNRFGHRIHAYCWMNNHIHLAVQVAEEPLAKIMQNLAFRYTRWQNKRLTRTGHLFQGRYKAILVDADSYLLELVRYIHLNPVRAGVVQDPADYPWSGHCAYLGNNRHGWLSTDWVLSRFAKRVTTARQLYRHFIEAGLDEGYRDDLQRGSTEGRLLGDDNFIESSLRKSEQRSPVSTTPEGIIASVCDRYEIDPEMLGSADRSRRTAEARAVSAYLAVETGVASLTRMGETMNRDVATLSNAVRRIRERLIDEKDLRARVRRLESAIQSRKEKIKA
jgi:REP element-mobilizing transposase RayT